MATYTIVIIIQGWNIYEDIQGPPLFRGGEFCGVLSCGFDKFE
jgi:hypothetical protein